MSESTHDLLVRGTAAARVGDAGEARFYLEWLLSLDPDEEEKLDACYWLAKVSDDPLKKRQLLEEVLASQPHHFLARREWMILQGKLSPGEVIDPNHVSRSAAIGEKRLGGSDLKSFICPNCGGRMVYSPDGTSLDCEYCEVRNRQQSGPALVENDFLLSLSTAKGHVLPKGYLKVACQQCGAEFLKGPSAISITCPFCESAYVVELSETKSETAPSAIFPARVSEEAAGAIFRNWILETKLPCNLSTMQWHGIYLPAWWFAIGGTLNYRYTMENKNRTPVSCQGSQPILRDNLCVPAGKRYSEELRDIIPTLDYQWMTAYKPDYLADWLAETYQVTVADASLEARSICLKIEKQKSGLSIPAGAENIVFDSHAMVVESYQLCLIPIWTVSCMVDGKQQTFVQDALNGRMVDGQDEPRSLWDRLMDW